MTIILVCLVVGLTILLGLSIWYNYSILKKLLFVSKNIYRISEVFEYFKNHVSGLHELEMYYGDQEIKNLIIHSQDVLRVVEEFHDIYVLAEDGELEEIIMELDKEEEKQIDNEEKKEEE